MSQSAMRGPVVVMEAEFEALRYDVDFDWHHECAIALARQSQVLPALAGPVSCGYQTQYIHAYTCELGLRNLVGREARREDYIDGIRMPYARPEQFRYVCTADVDAN